MFKGGRTLNIIALIVFICLGVFFIIEGSILVNYGRSNAKASSRKLSIAGTFTIILGLISLLLAGLMAYTSKSI